MSEFYDNLVASGIDPTIAASLSKQAEKLAKKATTAKTPGKKGKYFPGMDSEKPKKHNGIHEYTAVCATCGSRTTKRRVAQIDPNKPLPSVVPVSICESCIPFYRTLTQDDLISLILIKDNPDITLRMLSHKEQIAMARKMSPYEVISRKFEKEIDAPYEPEVMEITPEEDDEE